MSWHLYSPHMIITFPHNAWLCCIGENNSSFYTTRRWGICCQSCRQILLEPLELFLMLPCWAFKQIVPWWLLVEDTFAGVSLAREIHHSRRETISAYYPERPLPRTLVRDGWCIDEFCHLSQGIDVNVSGKRGYKTGKQNSVGIDLSGTWTVHVGLDLTISYGYFCQKWTAVWQSQQRIKMCIYWKNYRITMASFHSRVLVCLILSAMHCTLPSPFMVQMMRLTRLQGWPGH